jgi:hypothetical protein
MKILQRGTHNGKKYEVGKITYVEKDILNTEKSFNMALKTLGVIRTEAELMLYGKINTLEKNIHGKRKTS